MNISTQTEAQSRLREYQSLFDHSPSPATSPATTEDYFNPVDRVSLSQSVSPVTPAEPSVPTAAIGPTTPLPEGIPQTAGIGAESASKLVTGCARGLGVLGVVGGIAQIKSGVEQLPTEGTDGSLTIGAGTMNVVGGTLALAGKATLGMGLGSVAATLDGLKSLHDGQYGVGTLKLGEAAMMAAGVLCPPVGIAGAVAYFVTSVVNA